MIMGLREKEDQNFGLLIIFGPSKAKKTYLAICTNIPAGTMKSVPKK
jgi:hypothetical protein